MHTATLQKTEKETELESSDEPIYINKVVWKASEDSVWTLKKVVWKRPENH